jgi:hypothetical protein
VTFWVTDWLRAFGLTVLIELPLAVPLLRRVESGLPRRAAAVVAANLATHPLVWFLFPGLALGRPARLVLSEAWALIAEAVVYLIVWPALRLRRALLVSLIANGVSAAAGLILVRLLEPR